jgi:hypothetical protein
MPRSPRIELCRFMPTCLSNGKLDVFAFRHISGRAADVIIEVSHPGPRATAASMLALSQKLLGLAGGAFLTGVLADV